MDNGKTNKPLHIDSLHAFITTDENGDEGLCGAYSSSHQSWIPMVAADEQRIISLIPVAKQIEKQTGRKVKLVHFTNRQDVDEF